MNAEAQQRLAYFHERRDAIVSTIRELVEIESPATTSRPPTARRVIAEKFSQLGGEIRFHHAKEFGNHLQVNFGGKAAKPVCCSDITTPSISRHARENALHRCGRQAHGSGRARYEIGIALMLHAIAALQQWHKEDGHGNESGGQLPVPSTFCSSPTKKLAATLRGESPRPWRNERLRCWCSSLPTDDKAP